MKKLVFVLFLAAFVVFESCSDLKITSDYDKTADFSNFQTFNIMRYQEGSVESSSLSMMTVSFLEEAMIDELMGRGYNLSDGPDIEVYYFVKTKDKTQYKTTSTSVGMYGGSPYYYGYHGGYGYYNSYTQAVDYTVGSLIIELVDGKTNRLVWQGVAQKSLDQTAGSQKNISEIVNGIFRSYKWKATSPERNSSTTQDYEKQGGEEIENADR